MEKEYFKITSVARQDLEEIGFDASNVNDDTMEELASKMADAYIENDFWIELEVIADYLKIPKKLTNK
jgi:lipoate synthase